MNSFCLLISGLRNLMKVASRAERQKEERPRARIENCCSEERIGHCQEDVDQWQIREIVVGVCWPCKSEKGFSSCVRQED